jgi:hypothetical protein
MYCFNRDNAGSVNYASTLHPPTPFPHSIVGDDEEAAQLGKRRVSGSADRSHYDSPDSLVVQKQRRLQGSLTADGMIYQEVAACHNTASGSFALHTTLPAYTAGMNPKNGYSNAPNSYCEGPTIAAQVSNHGISTSSPLAGLYSLKLNSPSANKRETVANASRCVSCGEAGSTISTETCAFCSRTTCSLCLHFCAGCGLGFCAASCSTLVYLPRGTLTCCLDCARAAGPTRP